MNKLVLISVAAATLAVGAIGTASATDVFQQENGNAANTCTPALTQYDIGLRRRPLGITNEGTAAAFVNCAFRAPTNSYGQEDFAVKLRNYNAVARTVVCTGVIGVEDGQVRYSAKSVSVPAGGSALVQWTYGNDNNGARMQTNTGLQCLLQPGIAMTELPQTFRQK